MPIGRLSIISCRLLPDSAFRLIPASAFESHSGASDVLRELFKTIQVSVACQAFSQSFLDRSLIHKPVRTAQKIK
jgi:hypothetical protein